MRRLSPLLLLAVCVACPTVPDPLLGPADTPDPNPAAALRLNEVVTDNDDGLVDARGEHSDWIELWNADSVAIDLQGWTLGKEADASTLPAVTLLPGEFLVIFASGSPSVEDEIHLPWRLANEGEVLTLQDPQGRAAGQLVVPPLQEDMSWGPEQLVQEELVVGDGTVVRLAAAPPPGWEQPGLNDSTWATAILPIGFDGEVAAGDPTNVALGRPTSQSSDGYGYTGLQAVDGEPSTFSHTGDGDLQPWWEVDLGSTWTIERISILNRSECCPERLYNITTEILDGSGATVWSSDVENPVAEGDAPSSPGASLLFSPIDPVVGDRVRVSKSAVAGAGSSEWMSLAEVEVVARLSSPYEGLFTTDVQGVIGGADRLGLRLAIDVPSDAVPNRAILDLVYDDGVALMIDGVEALRTAAGAPIESPSTQSFALDPRLLQAGPHLLGLEVWTVDADDLLLAPELRLQTITSGDPALFALPTPGAPNGEGVAGLLAPPTFSIPRGFYEEPFTLQIAAPEGSDLVYTSDGSAPAEDHGVRIPAPAVASLTVAGTTIIRAVAVAEGWSPSELVTHSYLFLEDVVHQVALPTGLPAIWDGLSEAPVAADYEMDPEIVSDPAYAEDLRAGLRAIPTLSLVLAPSDLWDAGTGIYIHSAERGPAWERPVSAELILPDGSTAFAEICGVRIHGYGWRYHSATKKHSLRLEFSEQYGKSRLRHPWFQDSPVDSFDSIVLRAGGSKTWLDFRDPAQAQYLHDSFARDTAAAMGKVDGHATYVHLYLNGLYWGLYNPVERPEAGFGAAYFGGEAEEYDAINRRTTTNEAVDGTLDAWNELLALAEADLSTDSGMAAVESMLDLDDLIDYMLIQQYTVNRDGPCCFESNNMRGLRRRQVGELFRFFVWDMEYSLWDPTDSTNIDVDVPGSISHIYTRLRAHPLFRARFAERARLHLTGSGALTSEAAIGRYTARGLEIENALVAESARWGDTYREPPYTRDVEWRAEYDRIVTDFIPRRADLLIEQLTEAGLY